MNKVEIPLSKTKLLFGIVASVLLVLLSLWFFSQAEETAKTSVFFLFQNPFSNRIISGLGILFEPQFMQSKK